MADAAAVNRLDDLRRFYELLGRLGDRQDGPRPLSAVISVLHNQKGVYFFFEPDEMRSDIL